MTAKPYVPPRDPMLRVRQMLSASPVSYEIFCPLAAPGDECHDSRLRTFRRWPARRLLVRVYMRLSPEARRMRSEVERMQRAYG